MKRRDFLKTILGTAVAFFLPKPKPTTAISKAADEPEPRCIINGRPNERGNLTIIKGELGEVFFAGKWLNWSDPNTLVYTNIGWITATEVIGKEDYYGVWGHTMRCHGHPELAGVESGLAEFIGENNL